ncbi:tubby-related protein 4-like [Eurytemora carolleeae]|uniref:tubby-related protein 4-like n=1 Tax=Eurytemora carolleeae TaxID=1294199 RepID=UPI000C766F46|nr:tubby-related protein 4-like [Eurytemora carolleeae]XP_023327849.1 tubby-related protein 4-like [Eurytemora carolleeae]|eukprot:XP_023327848.1 tubby-related protein 4-like [Eurytemora affinis]
MPAQAGYQNLETFQKQKLRQKLRKLNNIETDPRYFWTPSSSPRLSPRTNRMTRMCGKELIMHNKAPLWNESSQVYQLDFGGRVTQESAKNFQIEFNGKQVMQFGRIDSNAYTLDFQYPFTAIQAFAVALANVTQRLK